MGGARPQAPATDTVHAPPLACGPSRLPGGQPIQLSDPHVVALLMVAGLDRAALSAS